MSEKLNVLIVDDSTSMRLVAKMQVGSLGHQVIAEAEDGKVALQKYLEHKPDVVLLDLVMPRFDGKKTLKKLLQLDPSAKVVICSSLGSEADIEYCLSNGALFYLQKPYEAEGINNALNTIAV